MGGSTNQAKSSAQSAVTTQQTDLSKAGDTSIPYVTHELQQSAGVLDQIRAGNFAGLPLVSAVNQGANAARNWRPQAMGDAALAASAAGQGGGYAQQQEAYRQRIIGDQIANIMPQAVEAERSNAEQELFPGAQTVSSFDLARAAGYGGAASAATSLYQAEEQNSFWGNLGRSFATGFGGSLGSSLGSFGGSFGKGGFTGSFGTGGG